MNYQYQHLSIPQLEERVRNMKIDKNEDTHRLFTFFKANVLHFMPNKGKELESLFKEVCLHQHLSWRDLQDAHVEENLSISGIKDAFLEQLLETPGIICTYHLGSYRLINRVLSSAGIPFSLLVNGTVFEEESKLEKNANDFQGGFVRTFDLIDAEQPTALLKMMRALKKGQNLLVYVDGNTGVKSGAENQVIVNFMAGQLRVRKGIAVLAELMQCPIYPVSCLRTSLYAVRFSTANAIVPPKDKMQHPDFIQNTMQTLYKQLEKQLHGHLSQWECWLYLHQFMVLPTAVELPSTVGIQELMDPNVWGSFSIDDHCFAFSMKSFSSFKIAKSVYERMRRIVLDNG